MFFHFEAKLLINETEKLQSSDRQKQIKESSLKYDPFVFSMYLHLFEIAVHLWLGFIKGTAEL